MVGRKNNLTQRHIMASSKRAITLTKRGPKDRPNRQHFSVRLEYEMMSLLKSTVTQPHPIIYLSESPCFVMKADEKALAYCLYDAGSLFGKTLFQMTLFGRTLFGRTLFGRTLYGRSLFRIGCYLEKLFS